MQEPSRCPEVYYGLWSILVNVQALVGIRTVTSTALGTLPFADIDDALAVAGIGVVYFDVIIGCIWIGRRREHPQRRERMLSPKR